MHNSLYELREVLTFIMDPCIVIFQDGIGISKVESGLLSYDLEKHLGSNRRGEQSKLEIFKVTIVADSPLGHNTNS